MGQDMEEDNYSIGVEGQTNLTRHNKGRDLALRRNYRVIKSDKK
jgi:hypothetical protein